MTKNKDSYRRILKSTSVIGGASFSNIVVGVLRSKIIALLLGPAGIGLASLYSSLISTATNLSTLGLGTVGTRQIAEASSKEDIHTLNVARRALFCGTLVLAIAGALVVWSLRHILAVHIFGNARESANVGWLSLGVALSVAAASQSAVIQGMRRIADIARLSIIASVLTTVLGLAIIWKWGSSGLVFYVLAGPVITFIVGHFYVARLPKLPKQHISLHELTGEWKMLLRLGVAIVGAGLIQSFSQLWIRSSITKSLGPGALGQYQAAWAISMQYVGFVLNAMGTDYYPRLTGIAKDTKAAASLVNEQTEIAMLLSGPVFIGIISVAPWLVHLLYAASFSPASTILQWQVIGDVLKVASWPIGFLILAHGDGKTFFWTEAVPWGILVGLILFLIPFVGIEITGIAYTVMYAIYLPMIYIIAHKRFDFRWSRPVSILFFGTLLVTISMDALSHFSIWGEVAGALLAIASGIMAMGRISHMGNIGGRAGKFGAALRRTMARFGL